MPSVDQTATPRKRGQTYPGQLFVRGVLVQEGLVNLPGAAEAARLCIRALITPRLQPQARAEADHAAD